MLPSLSSGQRTAGGPEVGTSTLGPSGESSEAAEKSQGTGDTAQDSQPETEGVSMETKLGAETPTVTQRR